MWEIHSVVLICILFNSGVVVACGLDLNSFWNRNCSVSMPLHSAHFHFHHIPVHVLHRKCQSKLFRKPRFILILLPLWNPRRKLCSIFGKFFFPPHWWERLRSLPLGIASWHRPLSHHVQCQHPTWASVKVLAVPSLTQLVAIAPGKAIEDGLNSWACALTWETYARLWLDPILAIKALWRVN